MKIYLGKGEVPPQIGDSLQVITRKGGKRRTLATLFVTGLEVTGSVGSSSGPDGSTTYYQGSYIVTAERRAVPLDKDVKVMW